MSKEYLIITDWTENEFRYISKNKFWNSFPFGTNDINRAHRFSKIEADNFIRQCTYLSKKVLLKDAEKLYIELNKNNVKENKHRIPKI